MIGFAVKLGIAVAIGGLLDFAFGRDYATAYGIGLLGGFALWCFAYLDHPSDDHDDGRCGSDCPCRRK